MELYPVLGISLLGLSSRCLQHIMRRDTGTAAMRETSTPSDQSGGHPHSRTATAILPW